MNYYSTGIEPLYQNSFVYKRRRQLKFKEPYYDDINNFWNKMQSGKYVFDRHKLYLGQVLKMFKL